MKTAIVTDTNSSIAPSMAEALGVHLIPMPFFIGDETYYEGKDMSHALFFQKMGAGVDVSTSQPAPADIIALWEKLLKDHGRILHFPMTSGLSGSCQAARAMAQEYDGRVLVVDDKRISVTLLQSIRNAKALLAQGKTAEEVHAILEAESYDSSIYIAVNTLEYLKKSGRVTAAGAAMASILSIKPVLQIQGGKLDAYKKVRGMSHAKTVLMDALGKDLDTRFKDMEMTVFAGYSGGDPSLGENWRKEVQRAFPEYEVELTSLPLSICCHIGEGALGVACAKKW